MGISKLFSTDDFSLSTLPQEDVSDTHMESADFGLSISGMNKSSGEENVHLHKVSRPQEPDIERGDSFFFLKMKIKNYFCPIGKLICNDGSLAVRWSGRHTGGGLKSWGSGLTLLSG